MRFDLLYICLLCSVILVTFYLVLMPQPALLASLDLHSMQIFKPHYRAGSIAQSGIIAQYCRFVILKNHLAAD